MKISRITTAAAILGLAVTSWAAPSASASAVGGQPSTKGIIVWTNRTPAGSEHLLIARADGARQRVLTPALADTFDFNAQVAPDGAWIAYEHNTPETATIHLVRPDGTRDHAIDVGCVDPCAAAVAPTWLSNSRLAFTRVDGPFDPVTGVPASAVLWSSRIDGSDVRRLSQSGIDGTFEDSYLRISPDRNYLTFQRVRDADGQSALFRMAPSGRNVRQLTPWEISAAINDLSTARRGPTKDLLVFDSGRGVPGATFVDLATVPATCTSLADCTAKIRWLTDNQATGRRNANPQWSPDGKNLVFTDRPSINDQNADIWTMRYRGTDRRKISTAPTFDYRPTWGTRD
jgi:Tol biopolymer transport system component